ncbi:MAG: M48 family metallopeptidase [Marinilabiliaceae bacterium]|nr:M48 family metallopeptidase [Marinilabiliaceae bacterium]
MVTANLFLIIILAIILFEYMLDRVLDSLNKKAWVDEVPSELKDVYPTDKFEKHKKYRIANYNFGRWSEMFNLTIIVAMLVYGGFALVDSWAASISENSIWRALIFFGIIGLASTIIHLPFSWYSTFVIEEKFGFNKTTQKTFWLDLLKGLLLGVLIGAPIMALIIWFYQIAGTWFWIYAWLLVGGFTIFMTMFYTSIFLPLFNKQKPLEEGELRNAIEEFSNKAGFKLDNIFVMDGSKRSTKANAFFSGLGSRKRIILYDTLINDLSTDEIVAVLAHEVGHYKLKHTLTGTILGLFQTGVILYIFSLVVGNPDFSKALGVEGAQFHIGLITFGILFSPISTVVGLLINIMSRKNEFAADKFASKYSNGEKLVSALKTISANALSNPTPHPVYVFFHYSHPPLLKRIETIKKMKRP